MIISFNRMFIPCPFDLMSPLSDMFHQGKRDPLIWTKELEERFNNLKLTLTTQPIFILPNINIPFAFRTDASDSGPGLELVKILLYLPPAR